MSGEFVVAVDVGGTLTKLSSTDRLGAAAEVFRTPTEREGGSVSLPWLARTISDVVDARGRAGCRGFGVAVPGIVDAEPGVVRAAPNLGWYDVALREELCRLTGLPGVVGHDVRLGGLAEWQLGAGIGCADLMFLALGTGIAAALVVDGRMLEAGGYVGEIGHVAVRAAAGLVCPCGRTGCLEMVASASGVSRTYARLSGVPADATEVAGRARAGEKAAVRAFEIITEALVEALDGAVTLLAPEVVIIGGGLSGALALFAGPVTELLAARLTFQRRPELRAARLGADAGVIGAGLLGWQRFGPVNP